MGEVVDLRTPRAGDSLEQLNRLVLRLAQKGALQDLREFHKQLGELLAERGGLKVE